MTKKLEKMYRRYAAIDIGSNAVRLLIKRFEKTETDVYSCKEQMVRVPLRLGFEVFKKNKISKEKEKDLARLMRSFIYLMKIYDVTDYKACATSALRDAKNGKDVVKRIKEKTGIRIDILNGQEEARGIYSSYAATDKGNCMYIDVGGGSTEISLISDGDIVYSRSFNIGTVRILCNALTDRDWKSMKDDLHELAGMYTDIKLIGSGGNINKIYRLIENRDKKQQRITVKSMSELYEEMRDMTVEQRVHNYGIRYDRADVIVPAGTIFLSVAEIIKAKYIYVPTVGLSDGIINSLFEKRVKKYGNSKACSSEIKDEENVEEDSDEKKNLPETDKKDNMENVTLTTQPDDMHKSLLVETPGDNPKETTETPE